MASLLDLLGLGRPKNPLPAPPPSQAMPPPPADGVSAVADAKTSVATSADNPALGAAAEMATQSANSKWRPLPDVEQDIREANRKSAEANSIAQDVVEEAREKRPSAHRQIRKGSGNFRDKLRRSLEEIMGDDRLSDELRRKAQKALGVLDEVQQDLERLWRERQHPHHPANVKQFDAAKKPPAKKPTTTKTESPGPKEVAPASKTPSPAVQKLEVLMNEHGKTMHEWGKQSQDVTQRRDKATTPNEKIALDKEARKLLNQSEALFREAELLAIQAVKLDQAGQIQASTGKGALEQARKPQKGSATLGGLGATLATLATVYFIAQDIKYILEADSAVQFLERAGEVGGKYAASAAEVGVIKIITGSNLATLGVQFLLSLDPRSGVQQQADALAAYKKAEEEQAKAQESEEHDTVAAFLLEHVPGVVIRVEDSYKIQNQKVYDETVEKIRLLKRQHAAAKREAYQRAFALGLVDGKTGNHSQRAQLLGFPELQYLPGGGAVTVPDLFATYDRGFVVSSLRQRARSLGVYDAKVNGSLVSGGAIKDWSEVKGNIMKEAELFVEYRDAFNDQIKR